MTQSGPEVLADLAREVQSRRGADPAQSYTAKLLSQGTARCAKKFGEEAVELVIATMTGDKAHATAEAADVIYHFLVLLEAAGLTLDDVADELQRRRGIGGLAEKASRKDV